MKYHQYANLFPMLSEVELDRLAEDIKVNGQQTPIVTYKDEILDGRNRYEACKKINREPVFAIYTGDNPLEHVISLNLHRRHLTESQRAMVAASLANLEKGQRADRLDGSIDLSTASDMLNVSEPTIKRAKKVQEKATPEINNLVTGGNLAVSQAAQIAEKPEDQQKEIAAKIEAGKKPVQAVREVQREHLNEKIEALPDQKYRVIYADPPWQYGDDRAGLSGYSDSAAEAQYPTMPLNEICDLDVGELAAPDCVLFLWATFPLLPDAIEVVNAWRFKYKTAFVWDKQKTNMGNYHDASAELLIVATKGSCLPEIDTRMRQTISLERGRHSAKPEHFREMIDSLYPSGPRIELFRRGDTPAGWSIWGNQAAA